MPMTDFQLVTDADIIKNETATGANTATRVGTMLDNIIVNKINNDKIDTNITLAANSDLLVASQKATKTYVTNQVSAINATITAGLGLKEDAINKSNGPLGSSSILFPTESSVSTALAAKEDITNKVTTQANFITDGSSVIKYPAIKAVKDYVDGVATGLLRDNGNYDPTVTGNYPTSANTLSGGAVQVGDLWYIDTAGTMNGNAVLVGYSVRALINGAGATTDADWAIANVGLGFIPEDSANKSDDSTFNSGSPSSTLFPTQAAVAGYVSNSVGSTSLQQVLNYNHDLTNEVNYQGTGAGTDAVGTRFNVNAFGSYAARFNSGNDINAFGAAAMGSSSLLTPNGNDINAFGNFAAFDVQGSDINAIGKYAAYESVGSYVNAIGNSVCNNNSGDYVNGIGYNCLLNNTGDNVSAIGFEAGNNNTFNYVNLFGHSAQADANNQTVFTNTGGAQVRIDYNSVSTDRKYILPDQSGTFAMLSDIAAPTLSQVTAVGNTTSDDIIISSAAFKGFTASSTGADGLAKIGYTSSWKGYLLLNNGSVSGTLRVNNLTASRSLQLPDATGILPLTVNGIAADTAGNITLPFDLPYLVYTAIIDPNASTITVLANTLGVTPTILSVVNGKIRLIAPTGTFTDDRTFIVTKSAWDVTNVPYFVTGNQISYLGDTTNVIEFNIIKYDGTQTFTPNLRGKLPIEIRVY